MWTFCIIPVVSLFSINVSGVDPPFRREVALDPYTASSVMQIRVESGSFVVVNRSSSPGYSTTAAYWATILNLDGGAARSFYPGKAHPEFSGFTAFDATLDPSQVLTISGIAWKGRGAISMPSDAETLVQYDARSGALLRIVRTHPIRCLSIASAGNGDLWCLGYNREERRAAGRTNHYRILHQFTPQGTIVASHILRADIATSLPVEFLSRHGNPTVSVLSSERVCVWLPAVQQVVVLDVASGNVRFLPVPPASATDVFHSVAFRPNGEMFAFLPFPANDSTSGRYRLHQWRLGDAESAPVRLADVPGQPGTGIGGMWHVVPTSREVHYAGKSTELVGFDGGFAVLYNLVDKQAIWAKIQPD